VVTTRAISRAKLQSNYHHHQTNTQFFTGWMPLLSPNQQCQSPRYRDHIIEWCRAYVHPVCTQIQNGSS